MRKRKAYISGALTALIGVEEPGRLKRFYEEIGRVCEGVGIDSYIPHQRPIADEEVFRCRVDEVQNSDLLIAYVGIPSFDVGSEIGAANQANVPVILLYEKGRPVSRVARGNPAVIAQICFETFDEALSALEEVFGLIEFG